MEFYAVRRSDPSDELKHWKYIKREKKNGKWRYTYDDSSSEANVLKKKADEAQKKLDEHFEEFWQKRYESDIASAQANLKTNPQAVENVNRWYSNPEIKERTKETYREGDNLRWWADWEKYWYEREKDSLGGKIDASIIKTEKWVHDKVLNTKVGDITADVIGRGEEQLNSLVEKLKKNIGITAKEDVEMYKSKLDKMNVKNSQDAKIKLDVQEKMRETLARQNDYNRQAFEAAYDKTLSQLAFEQNMKKYKSKAEYDDEAFGKYLVSKVNAMNDQKRYNDAVANYEREREKYKKLQAEDIRLGEKRVASIKSTDELVKKYANARNEYDNSLIGRVDRGKQTVTALLKKQRKR